MASSLHFILFFSLLFISSFLAQTSFRPKALVLPVSKNPSTLQYITHLNQRTHLVSVNLTLHLGGESLWVDSESKDYVTSIFCPARCRSTQCNLVGSTACVTATNTCGLFLKNTVTRTSTYDDLGSDVSTNGKNPGRVVFERDFLLVCTSPFLLEGLTNGVQGMAGLRRSRISLPSQFSASFSFLRKFAVCLTS
ncbi:hypothetical protein RJ639_009859 [Escallonia herrerae]|uniref:Xylanase inhibitor N-terminal domain-containing protein n=1 Tax=Escallonia herrerae TaxID=1293975 RepID=A0AA89ASI9_9ASTE|nr:hypothetical protein RJ639_009859 [Escallonia herrerae]